MCPCTQVRSSRVAKKLWEVVHFYYSLQVDCWRALCKKEIILHQGQKAIAAQLLRSWNRFLGTIDLHNINVLNKGLHIGTVCCVCSNCKELMSFIHLVVHTAISQL